MLSWTERGHLVREVAVFLVATSRFVSRDGVLVTFSHYASLMLNPASHCARCYRFGVTLVALLTANAHAGHIEFGGVTVQDTFTSAAATRVSFREPFDSVPVVVSLPTTDGSDPSTLRISAVTRFGFDVVQTEPSGNDGPHVAMPTAYLAVSVGTHALPGGGTLTAFVRDTASTVSGVSGQTWDSALFATRFSAPPAVVAALQSSRNETANPPSTASSPFLAVAIRSLSANGIEFALERAESSAGSVNASETVGFIALDNRTNVTLLDTAGNPATLQALVTNNSIEGFDNGCFASGYVVPFPAPPLAVASMVTRNGGNGGWLRRCSISGASLGLTVDEDIDNDSERSHIDETAAIVAADRAFHANLGVGLAVAKTVRIDADPISGSTDAFAIPGATVHYDIEVSNAGSGSPDNGSLTITDAVPAQLSLCVLARCLSGGPVVLTDGASPIPTGLTLSSITYSNDGGTSFGYTPVPDDDGFDGAVSNIRVTLTGTMPGISAAGEPAFTLRLAARVN